MPRPRAKARDKYLEPHPNGSIYFRITLPGTHGPVPVRQSLGPLDIETARRVRDALVTTLYGSITCKAAGIDIPENALARQFGAEAMLAKLDIIRHRQNTPSIAEVIAAFELDATGRDISPKTVTGAISSLRSILRTVYGPNPEPDARRVSELTEDLLDDYKTAKLAEAKPHGPDRVASAKVTVTSTVSQARTMFSKPSMRLAHLRALNIDTAALTPFLRWQSGYTTRRTRAAMDDATVSRLIALIDGLWFNDPAAYLALTLAANVGRRRGEATMARWSWVRMIRQKPTMYLLKTDEAQPKGNETSVEIPIDVWQDMSAHRSSSEYIVPGETRAERDDVFNRTCAMLREIGIDVGKPNHELRALQLQRARDEYGMDNAQAIGGHSDRRTTEIYTGKGSGKAIRVL
jgi:integrase